MPTLSFPVKGSFTAADAKQEVVTRRASDPSKFDVTVYFTVEDGSGNELDTWPHEALDINPLDHSSWFTAAFRSAAWAAYKTANGYTES